MTAQILDGTLYSQIMKDKIKETVEILKVNHGIVLGLTVIIVGEDPASCVYVNNKHKACQEFGIASDIIRLPATTDKDTLLNEIHKLNHNPQVHGLLVQSPLPPALRPYESAVLHAIHPDKDVDGFHPVNVGRLALGDEHLVPCTPYGCIKMLELAGISLEGKHAVIIGRSHLVGKPMFQLLLARHATVTVCHSHTRNLADITKQADILVAAIGQARFVTPAMVKPGAVVIDVGITRIGDKKLVGDVDFEGVKEVAGAITPVPGGVGKLTTTMLLHNTVKAALLQHKPSGIDQDILAGMKKPQ